MSTSNDRSWGRGFHFVPIVAVLLVCSFSVGCGGTRVVGANDTSRAEPAEQVATNSIAVADSSVDEVLDSQSMENRLRESVRYLASDELEGRGVGTDGLDRAADYLAGEFSAIGLNTRLIDNGPFQHFSKTSRLALGSTNEAVLAGPAGAAIKLVLGENFTPLSLSASGQFDLPLVFVGYGITAPKLGYDDYAGIDVAGKAVVILRHEPQADDPQSRFDGIEHTEHGYFLPKVENAIAHGAAAVILCTDRRHAERVAGEIKRRSKTNESDVDPLLSFKLQVSINERRIPVLHCRRAAIDQVLRSSGKSLEEIEKTIDAGPSPQSAALQDWRIAGEVSVLKKGRSLKNVLGLLEGDGSKADETIVVGAHYDHLGRGGWGSLAWDVENEIHNGADDNASGTAVLVEVARQLAARRGELKRRVLFIAFTAEEMGLVGSEHYVADPVVPLKQTVAMLNLDMVGRLRKEHLIVSGTGTAAEFSPLIDRLGASYGFKVTQERDGYGPSDHASFFQRGVPVMHFFTGLHADYHRPSDDSELLNIEGMSRIASLFSDAVIELSQAESRPQKRATESSELLADDDDGDKSSPARVTTGYAVAVLGIEKGTKHPSGGYAVQRLEPGGPAELAGLRSGDVIQRIDGHAANTADQIQSVLKARATDKPCLLHILRGKTELELEVRPYSR